MERTDERRTRASDQVRFRLRWIAVRGFAGAVAGVVVLGVGGRLVMLASRLLHPTAIGLVTENGNRIGEFTVDGTIGLILFGGLLSGLVAGVVWALVRQWLPPRPWLVGVGAVAIGGFVLVEADNPDFVILRDPRIDIVLLLGLVFVFGVVLARTDDWLDRRLPRADRMWVIALYAVVVGNGLLFAQVALGTFLSRQFCFCENPPVATGLLLILSGVLTAGWWILGTHDETKPPRWLGYSGSGAVGLAAAAGAAHLTGQVMAIL